MSVLEGQVNEIARVVDRVVQHSEETISRTTRVRFRNRGERVVRSLASYNRRMYDMLQEMGGNEDSPNKAIKQSLAGAAFDTAKTIKELVRVVEEADHDETEDLL